MILHKVVDLLQRETADEEHVEGASRARRAFQFFLKIELFALCFSPLRTLRPPFPAVKEFARRIPR